MADKVKFKKGLSTTLPTTKEAGSVLITTDTGEMYFDIDSSTRIAVGTKVEPITNDEIDEICGNTDMNGNNTAY